MIKRNSKLKRIYEVQKLIQEKREEFRRLQEEQRNEYDRFLLKFLEEQIKDITQ